MTFGIRAKLLAAFVAVALCTAALGWYAVTSMERLNDGQRTLYGDIFGGTHLLARWVDTSWEARSSLLVYLLTHEAAERTQLRARMAELDGTLDDLVRQMDEADTDRKDVQTLTGLAEAWQGYAEWRDRAVIAPMEAGDQAAAGAAYRTDGAPRLAALDLAIDAFLEKKGEVGGSLGASAEATYEQTRSIAVGLAAIATGLALLIGYFLSRGIAGAAGQVAASAKALVLGDLDQRITVRSTDELGQMAEAFRAMIGHQQEMAAVADAIAHGDLTRDVQPKSDRDVLGCAIHRMRANLRTLIYELKQAVEQNQALNADLEQRVADRTVQLEHAVCDLQQQVAERRRAEAGLRESEGP
jgi:methyl-accepting chemotaxis protein